MPNGISQTQSYQNNNNQFEKSNKKLKTSINSI